MGVAHEYLRLVSKKMISQRGVEKPVARLREEVMIKEGPGSSPETRVYQIEDKNTGEVFSFGEEEYFLCQALDGVSQPGDVLSRFSRRFGVDMSAEHFQDFQNHLMSMGIAEPSASVPATGGSAKPKPAKSSPTPKWEVGNPAGFFEVLLKIFGPLRPLVLVLVWSLWVVIPAVAFVIFRHLDLFRVEVRSMSMALGYFGGILFGMLTANLIRCLVQGVVMAYYRIPPEAAGIKLRRLIFPRLYIDKTKVRTLDRHSKLWIFGTSILIRLFFIAGGGLVWALNMDNPSLLPQVGVVMAQAGLIGLLIQFIPVDITDGYRWIVNYFNLPPTMLFLATKVFFSRIQRKPLPGVLGGWQGTVYMIYGAILIIGLPFILFHLATKMAAGFSGTFPVIFGRATYGIFLLGFLILLGFWFTRIVRHPRGMVDPDEGDEMRDYDELEEEASVRKDQPTVMEFVRRHKLLTGAVVAGLLMCVPTPFRPGGEIQVLPPTQQQIQAPVSGKVAKVFFEGGDGRLIPKGEVIAKMTSSEIDNQILTLTQTKSQLEADLQKSKSELAKLQSGARGEEIAGAEAKLQQTVEQMSGAQQELESARVSAAYSTMALPRMEKLYKSGSMAYLQFEEAKKLAQIDRINVERASKNVASLTKARDEAMAHLNLLKSGARPEDLDSARHSVESAQAEVARVDQQIQYAKGEDAKSALLMPFDGYLVDSQLHFKVGAYLSVGQVFATAQNNSDPQVEVQLPEYDLEGVRKDAVATVKLFAFPNSPFTGSVTSIQPAALPGAQESELSITRLFRVVIKPENSPVELKAGMTGYAKINAGVQPLGLLLARPFLRFFLVEMWSWLP